MTTTMLLHKAKMLLDHPLYKIATEKDEGSNSEWFRNNLRLLTQVLWLSF